MQMQEDGGKDDLMKVGEILLSLTECNNNNNNNNNNNPQPLTLNPQPTIHNNNTNNHNNHNPQPQQQQQQEQAHPPQKTSTETHNNMVFCFNASITLPGSFPRGRYWVPKDASGGIDSSS